MGSWEPYSTLELRLISEGFGVGLGQFGLNWGGFEGP